MGVGQGGGWSGLLVLGLLTACHPPSARICSPPSQMYDPAPPRVGRTWLARGGRIYGARPGTLGPIGGGKGHRKIVTRGNKRVKTLDGLIAALKLATPGTVVFVDGRARIDCTVRVLADGLVLEIPAGVTLASDRGRSRGEGRGTSAGALIFSDTRATRPLIRAGGPGVRVTGLRLRGPDPKPRTDHHRRSFAEGRGHRYYYRYPVSVGIRTLHSRLLVDNCEVAGWSHAAIHLKAGQGHHIHHSYLHHNQLRGLGYGVGLDRATALIEHNLFHYNRHSIAGTGRPGSGYEARHNVELGRSVSHCFDLHGGADRRDSTNVAGTWLKIHHNTFRACPRAIAIRGVPQRQARVHHNWFSHRGPAGAIYSEGNTRVYDNAYGVTRPRFSVTGVGRSITGFPRTDGGVVGHAVGPSARADRTIARMVLRVIRSVGDPSR